MEENKQLPELPEEAAPTPGEAMPPLTETAAAEPASLPDTPVEMEKLPVTAEEAPITPEEPAAPGEPEMPAPAAEEAAPAEEPAPEKEPDTAEEADWFESLLKSPEIGKEIMEDTHALSIGPSHISDLELEKIIQETINEDWTAIAEDEQVLPPPEPMMEQEEVKKSAYSNPSFYTDNGEMPDDPEEEDEEEDEPVEDEYDEPEEEEEPEAPPRVPRKVRPRRKNSYGLLGIPHLVSVAIWALIAITIGVSLGRLAWVCASDILAFGRQDQKVTITITHSDNIDSITKKLHNAGLIKYPSLFKFYAGLAKADKKISVGTFDLNTLYDYHALVGGMSATSSYRKQVKVTIPEGYTCMQIFQLLEEQGVCKVTELEEFCLNGEIRERWFLEGISRDNKYCLEGFLSPDTYNFYTDDTPSRVIGKFLDAFTSKLDTMTVEPRTQLAALNERLSAMMRAKGYSADYIAAHQLTFRDLVTVASMIEKESANSAESYTVSAVIYNRLANPEFPYLEIDATIVYALGGKNDLTSEDLQIDHPYNTYKVEGLPPGPISNPGLTSLYAALDPDEEPYYFYALNPATGLHHFSKTYQEHKQFLDSIR